MIGRGQVEAQHPEDRPQKALRLTKGQVKDQAERQRGFDGNLGVLQLPGALADAHGLPRGDRFRRQPQGDVASLDQCSVVRRPVSDAVFRFVPGMHSRLHVEIMPLRPSRWPGPRRTLVTAHQRHGCLRRARYLIHDRDPLYTRVFGEILEGGGVQPIRLPPKSPNLNAYAERFVRSIKEECLSRVVPLGEGHLRLLVGEYVEHDHRERNHQGLDNQLLQRPPPPVSGADCSISTTGRPHERSAD